MAHHSLAHGVTTKNDATHSMVAEQSSATALCHPTVSPQDVRASLRRIRNCDVDIRKNMNANVVLIDIRDKFSFVIAADKS